MCSRFELNRTFEEIVLRFDITVTAQDVPTSHKMGEVRPTDQVPIITNKGQIAYLHWGLKVDWNKNPIINARSETLSKKPTFQTIIKNRCLIPATAYFEWRKEGNLKIKTRIYPHDQKLISFAGLFDGENFTIITCKPSPSISHIHDRMPVILDQADETAWLSINNSFSKVADLLKTKQNSDLQTEEIQKPPKTNSQQDLFN